MKAPCRLRDLPARACRRPPAAATNVRTAALHNRQALAVQGRAHYFPPRRPTARSLRPREAMAVSLSFAALWMARTQDVHRRPKWVPPRSSTRTLRPHGQAPPSAGSRCLACFGFARTHRRARILPDRNSPRANDRSSRPFDARRADATPRRRASTSRRDKNLSPKRIRGERPLRGRALGRRAIARRPACLGTRRSTSRTILPAGCGQIGSKRGASRSQSAGWARSRQATGRRPPSPDLLSSTHKPPREATAHRGSQTNPISPCRILGGREEEGPRGREISASRPGRTSWHSLDTPGRIE